MRQCSISPDHAPQNMDAALSLTPTGLSRGNFQLRIERTVRRKAIERERVRMRASAEVPLQGVSPFVGSLCSFHIYLNSDREVDFLRVSGLLAAVKEKVWERQESHTENKWQNKRYRLSEKDRNVFSVCLLWSRKIIRHEEKTGFLCLCTKKQSVIGQRLASTLIKKQSPFITFHVLNLYRLMRILWSQQISNWIQKKINSQMILIIFQCN